MGEESKEMKRERKKRINEKKGRGSENFRTTQGGYVLMGRQRLLNQNSVSQ